MADVLIFGDTVRSQELRHEVPLMIPDAFLYAEREGVRHVVGASLEEPRFAELGDYTFHPFEEFGLDEIREAGLSRVEMIDELAVRAVQALGVSDAVVPASFPVLTADRLRGAGVVLTPDQDSFDARRRVKSEAELAGIRRAQRAAEAGIAAAAELLRRAAPGPRGVIQEGGRPLTCERLKAVVARAFAEHAATAEEFVVSHGPQAAVGHHMGEGEIRVGEPIVIDVWDNASSCFADMTRTFVVGEIPDELSEWHRLCKEALARARAFLREGVSGKAVYDTSCEVFEAAGYATQRTKREGETLDHGFFHSLGHGVGLAVHEEPFLALYGRGPLVEGDVITLEPGLYRPGFGGVRLEDVVRVTKDGAETLTSFPYDLTP
jgi:Xaa-Pro aminopeptidase